MRPTFCGTVMRVSRFWARQISSSRQSSNGCERAVGVEVAELLAVDRDDGLAGAGADLHGRLRRVDLLAAVQRGGRGGRGARVVRVVVLLGGAADRRHDHHGEGEPTGPRDCRHDDLPCVRSRVRELDALRSKTLRPVAAPAGLDARSPLEPGSERWAPCDNPKTASVRSRTERAWTPLHGGFTPRERHGPSGRRAAARRRDRRRPQEAGLVLVYPGRRPRRAAVLRRERLVGCAASGRVRGTRGAPRS